MDGIPCALGLIGCVPARAGNLILVRVTRARLRTSSAGCTRPLWSVPQSEPKIADRSALKRWGTADDLVEPILFLCSPAANFVTGVTLPVGGGYSVG